MIVPMLGSLSLERRRNVAARVALLEKATNAIAKRQSQITIAFQNQKCQAVSTSAWVKAEAEVRCRMRQALP